MNLNKNQIILSILSLGLLVGNGASAEDLFKTQQAELKTIIGTIMQTNQEIRKLDLKIEKIDQDIELAEEHDTESWLSRRRIVKLTEQKAILNSQRLRYYESLLQQQNLATEKSNGLFEKITEQTDKLLTEINSHPNTETRKSDLDQLLQIIDLRNWIIDTKPLYSQLDSDIIPVKINIQDYLDDQPENSQIRRDLLALMDEKIRQVTLMIKTAREEEKLRSKLEQFSLEMSSLGGEYSRTAPEKTLPIEGSKEMGVNSGWDDGSTFGEYGENNRQYSSWANTTQSRTFSSITGYDYLPIIKNIESTELPNYIFTLDSIRTYYLDQKQKLLNH